MTPVFGARTEYPNLVYQRAVTRAQEVLERFWSDAASEEDLRKAIRQLRAHAAAHSLAAEASRQGVLAPATDLLTDADSLAAAAGQLYLRAARMKTALREQPVPLVDRDRIEAAIDFLSAGRPAVAAAVAASPVDGAPKSDLTLPAGLLALVRSGFAHAGVVPLAEADLLLARARPAVSKQPLAAVIAVAAGALKAGSAAFQTGRWTNLDAAIRQLRASAAGISVLYDGVLAATVDRYADALESLRSLSIWNLTADLRLANPRTTREVVRHLSGRMKFLFAPQLRAIRDHGVLNQARCQVISMPTGSGKTLLAELLAIKHLDEFANSKHAEHREKRVFFVVPSRALAREKLRGLRELLDALPSLGATACQLTGDVLFDAKSAIEAHQAIVATPEKFDMILREPELRTRVGAVIVDEFHNIRLGARGLRLIGVISRLRHNAATRDAPVHLVSAIVRDEDLAVVCQWLGRARPEREAAPNQFQSVDPPLFIRTGTFDFVGQKDSRDWWISYDDGTRVRVDGPSVKLTRAQHGRAALHLATQLADEGAVLLFATAATWRWEDGAHTCEPIKRARAIAESMTALPAWVDRDANARLVDALRKLYGTDHEMVANAKRGVGAHWGALPLRARRVIEHAVLERGLAVLVATSTLAEGVNLPFRRLIVPKCTFRTNEPFDVGFFLNLKGRAGRPFMTEEGEVVLLESSRSPAELVRRLASATFRDVEALRSPVTTGPTSTESVTTPGGLELPMDLCDSLDIEILAMIVEHPVSRGKAVAWLSRQLTLAEDDYAAALPAVDRSLTRLTSWAFVELADRRALRATPRGQRVYKSGFAPRVAAATHEQLDQADRPLDLLTRAAETSSPMGTGAYGLLEVVFELLHRTGAWRDVERAALRSAKQAAFLTLGWARGTSLGEIADEKKKDRLYLHSVLEGVLAPLAAWYCFSLSIWLQERAEREPLARTASENLARWSEFLWFGAPPGRALALLKRDFEGLLFRDDALRIARQVGARDWRRLERTRGKALNDRFVEELLRNVSDSVDPPERIAYALRRIFRFGE